MPAAARPRNVRIALGGPSQVQTQGQRHSALERKPLVLRRQQPFKPCMEFADDLREDC